MEGNQQKMREALTNLVTYLNNEVKRTIKCKQCEYRGKTFRGEPCYWHVDCGIEDYDKKASYNAMYLMKRFKLQKALSAPPRNCDEGTVEEQIRRYKLFCENHSGWDGQKRFGCKNCPFIDEDECEFAWAQMPYKDEGGAE